MKKMQAFFPVVIVFVMLTVLLLVLSAWLTRQGLDQPTLLWGNVFLFLLTGASFLLLKKAVTASSPQIFVRYFYISFTVKFFLVAVAALLYGRMVSHINRPSVIVCMALYIVYTFIEMRILLKGGKK